MKATFHFHFLECKLVQLPGLSRSTAPSLRAEGAHSSRATTLETSLTLQCLDSLGQRAPPSRSWRDVKALEAGGKVLQSADRPCSSQGCLRGEGLRVTCPCLTFPHLKYWCDAKSVHCSWCQALGESVMAHPRALVCLTRAFAPHQGRQAGAEPPALAASPMGTIPSSPHNTAIAPRVLRLWV